MVLNRMLPFSPQDRSNYSVGGSSSRTGNAAPDVSSLDPTKPHNQAFATTSGRKQACYLCRQRKKKCDVSFRHPQSHPTVFNQFDLVSRQGYRPVRAVSRMAPNASMYHSRVPRLMRGNKVIRLRRTMHNPIPLLFRVRQLLPHGHPRRPSLAQRPMSQVCLPP